MGPKSESSSCGASVDGSGNNAAVEGGRDILFTFVGVAARMSSSSSSASSSSAGSVLFAGLKVNVRLEVSGMGVARGRPLSDVGEGVLEESVIVGKLRGGLFVVGDGDLEE